MPPTDESVLKAVLDEAWRGGISLQGDFARKRSSVVAMAASSQLITTREDSGVYGRTWRITSKGLRWRNEHETRN